MRRLTKRVERAQSDDKYGDVVVGAKASHEVHRKWLEMARPAPGPGGLRRPLWFSRPVRPDNEAYAVKERFGPLARWLGVREGRPATAICLLASVLEFHRSSSNDI